MIVIDIRQPGLSDDRAIVSELLPLPAAVLSHKETPDPSHVVAGRKIKYKEKARPEPGNTSLFGS
jgi:hypothetical protein